MKYHFIATCQALSPGCRTIDLIAGDGEYERRHIDTGEILISRQIPFSDITAFACDGFGFNQTFMSRDGRILFENQVANLRARKNERNIVCLAGGSLLVVNDDNNLIIWNSDTEEIQILAEDIPAPLIEMRFLRNGSHVLVVAGSQHSRILMIELVAEIWRAIDIPYQGCLICCADASQDGEIILLATMDRYLSLLTRSDSKIVSIGYQSSRDVQVTGLPMRCVLGEGDNLGAAFLTTKEGYIVRWDPRSGNLELWQRFSRPGLLEPIVIMESLLPRGEIFISSTSRAWSISGPMAQNQSDDGHREAPRDCFITQNNRVVSMSNDDHYICWFAADGGRLLGTPMWFRTMSAITPHSNQSAVIVGDQLGHLWTISHDSAPPGILLGCVLNEPVVSLCLGANGEVYAAGASGEIMRFDFESGTVSRLRKSTGFQRLIRILPSQGRGILWRICEVAGRLGTTYSVTLILDSEHDEELPPSSIMIDHIAIFRDMVCVPDSRMNIYTLEDGKWIQIARNEISAKYVSFWDEGSLLVAINDENHQVEVLDMHDSLKRIAATYLPLPATCISTRGSRMIIGCLSGNMIMMRGWRKIRNSSTIDNKIL